VAIASKILGFKSLFLAGLAAVVLGYLTLKGGSMTLAPALLVAGYCVLIPTALFRLGHSGAAGPRDRDSGRRAGE
jgi:ribose/xylose/arabinose/galactoside ABC-type transport system permease subunit